MVHYVDLTLVARAMSVLPPKPTFVAASGMSAMGQ